MIEHVGRFRQDRSAGRASLPDAIRNDGHDDDQSADATLASVDEFSIGEVAAQLRALGVRHGGVLLVHTSFRAVAPIEHGPVGLIRALRDAVGDEGTLVMPAMTDGETPFDPASTPTHAMGITAETFWRQLGVLRSTHPGGSFAALGPLAPRICAPQPLSPPHGRDSPPGRVLDLDGQVLLLGVTHSENTTLHVAEAIAQVPYSISHPCVVEIEGVVGSVMIAETDHCCRGFGIADEWLRERGLQREGKVGNADARLCRSRDLVAAALENLARDPLLFLCANAVGCVECDMARDSVPSGAGRVHA
jgi:aminoglycoside 3-N-acetyltransferase